MDFDGALEFSIALAGDLASLPGVFHDKKLLPLLFGSLISP